jgi:hypothetical protein
VRTLASSLLDLLPRRGDPRGGGDDMMLRWAVVGLALVGLVVAPAIAPVYAAEEKGQTFSLDQVPGPVKATIDKEVAKGMTLKDITKETEKGKTFFEARMVKKNGKETLLHIADNGKILKHESPKAEAKKEMKEEKKEEKKY